MMRSRPAFSFIVVAALVLGACSSGDSSNGDPTVPIPTAGTSPNITTSTSTSSSDPPTGSTTTSTSPATSNAPTATATTTGGPTTTLVRPAEVGYANGQYLLNPTSTELMGAPISDEMRSRENSGLVERTQLNQVLDISGGMTLRPYVVENDDPTRAFVWDCQIDATFWKDKDTGAKAPPDAWPNNGPPGVEVGISAVMVLVEGEWLLDDGGLEPRACE